MYCLYCKKRLWKFFSKERLFCSKLHEAAYQQEELSTINRLIEFVSRPEPPALPAPRNREVSEIYREGEKSSISMGPPSSNIFFELWSRPKPIPPDAAALV